MTEAPSNYSGGRIQLIDALRGLAVVLMCFHHLFYDCVDLLGAPQWLFWNPVFNFLHYVFAGTFILLCGVSCRFSRSNLRRGLIALGCAAAITLVTVLLEMDIWFGVLHLLAFCMLFFAATGKLWDKLPGWLLGALWVILIPVSAVLLNKVTMPSQGAAGVFFWVCGWNPDLVFSNDYFPLLPWIFVFLLGTVLGTPIREGRFPKWFYTWTCPFFPAVGRKALLVYIVHQPVLYGLVWLIAMIAGK